MIVRAVSIAVALFVTSNANAATVLFKDYKHPKDELTGTFNKLYLDGVKEGLIAYNVALAQDGQTPYFCPPPKMALTTDQAEDILLREAKVLHDPDKFPISTVLLEGLKETFPCEAQSK
jgi:hypothetical protein